MIVSAVIVVLSIFFFAYEMFKVVRHRESSPRRVAATYIGVIGAMGTTAILVFGAVKYLDAQKDRRHILEEIKGISSEIDRRVESSLHHRVSYFHTQDLLRLAVDTCRKLSSQPASDPPSACVQINESQ